jgi:hypothetical protein
MALFDRPAPRLARAPTAAALAVASRAGGVVIEAYGLPVDRPEDLLPG